MILSDKIFLTGMPGSGKSTLGESLAEVLELKFIDLDQEIEIVSRKSIKEIFEVEGEKSFRIIEKNQLKKSIQRHPKFLMAVGGGTPCFFDNMEIMKSAGLVIFLDISELTLKDRLLKNNNTQNRPLLKGINDTSISEELRNKRVSRLPFYSQAHITLEGDYVTIDSIKEAVEKHQRLAK